MLQLLPLRQRRLFLSAREHDEQAEAFVAGEPMFGACRNEGRLALVDGDGVAFDGQLAAAFEDDVELVVGVGALMVWLGATSTYTPTSSPGES